MKCNTAGVNYVSLKSEFKLAGALALRPSRRNVQFRIQTPVLGGNQRAKTRLILVPENLQ